PAAGFVIEAVLAFFLVTIVLSTAVAGRARSLAPLAIGMTLTLNIMMGGALTGAPFNPARALGPMVATGNFTDAWLYMIAPVVGAVIAAFVHLGLTRLAREQQMSSQIAATPAEGASLLPTCERCRAGRAPPRRNDLVRLRYAVWHRMRCMPRS